MKDFIYGEGGLIVLLGIDEAIAHLMNNPDLIPHEYKWGLPFLVVVGVMIKRRLIKKK